MKTGFTVRLFGLLFAALLIAGCTGNHSPREVSRDFWRAMAEGNIAAARELATEGSLEGVSADQQRRIENLQFGEARLQQGGGQSLVATSFTSVNDNSRISLSFDTVLEQQDGHWRVNFTSTTQSMLGSSFQQLQDALSETISEAGNAIGEAMDEALDEAAGQMSEVLQEAAREMQQAADDIRTELEKLKQDDTSPADK